MMTFVWQFVLLFVATAALFAALTAAMSLLTRFIGEERLRRWIGGNTFTAAVKGLVFGVITPFCSWSTVPVLMSLLRARVRTSAVAAFYIASPVLDPVLIIAIGWLFGFWVAVWFTVFLTASTLITACLAEHFHVERLILSRALTPASSGTDMTGAAPEPDCASAPWQNWRAEAKDALSVAKIQVRTLIVPLAITCLIGVAIAGVVPERLMLDLTGPNQPLAIPAAALLSVPLYLPTEALAPLGFGLRDAGIGLGAIFAFMITAASLSLPEFALLSRTFRLRLILGLVATVMLIAVIGAFLVPLASTPV